jgi:hypothetical protein
MTGSDATIEANRQPPGEPETPRAQIAALAPSAFPADVDSGQPVDVPPPLIEPVGFDDALPHSDSPPGQRPARRSFLTPLVDDAGMTTVTSQPIPAEAPVPAPAEPLPIAEFRPAPARIAELPPAPVAELRAATAPAAELPAGPLPPAGRQALMRLLALAQQWRRAASAPPASSWRQILYWGQWVLAAAIIIGLLYLAG